MCNTRVSITMGSLLPVLVLSLLTVLPSYSEAQLPVIRNGDSVESPFALVYKKVAPAVVRIDIRVEGRRRNPSPRMGESPWDYFFDDPQPDGRPRNRSRTEIGSGIIIDREGHVITNNHVIENADSIKVRVNQFDEYRAEVVGRDPDTDLAIIKLDLGGELLPSENVAELGDSDDLQPGDYAVAIGNPLGLERTITVGVISALNRYEVENPVGAGDLEYKDFIQTDAQINPGNSGGALADINGRVIGINNMYAAENAGIGFAIPINLAKIIAHQIIASGIVKRGFIGLGGTDIDRETQRALDLDDTSGFQVDNITSGFPADNAGIQRGDIIRSLNGTPIRNYNDFRFKIAEHMPGDIISLTYIRDAETSTVQVTLEDRDKYLLALEELDENNWRGINVVDLDSPLARNYQSELFDSGVLIVSIDPGSPAAEAGALLTEGDVIVEIDNRPIRDVADFLALKRDISDSEQDSSVILIYRQRVTATGRIGSGLVAVKEK